MANRDDGPRPLLSMRHITKQFPGVLALDDVRFELAAGEVHALIGENGAGKSTLIKILCGAHRATHGAIFLEGRQVDVRDPHHAQTLGVQTIHQEVNVVPDISVAENMFLGRELNRGGFIAHGEQIRRTNELLDRFNYRLDPRRMMASLNTSERHMISIIKALSGQVKILILDEPTASLTDREKDLLFDNIRRLKAAGTGIIYISHRLEELKEIGDRVTVLRNGQYVDTLMLADITGIDDLLPLMLGKEVKNKYPKVVAETGKPLLKVQNLSRSGVFQDISFECRAGEVLGIFGLVGCGFEEVLRSVFGADPYDTGRVEVAVNGGFAPIPKNDPKAALDQHISYLPRDRKNEGLVMPMSVGENIVLASYHKLLHALGFIALDRVAKTAQEYWHKLNIKTPSLKTLVETLSGGNQQKVIMAKALCRGGNVFLFSEPTAGIDVGSKVEIYQFMNELTAEGAAIGLVSYELDEVMGMSDRILVMYQGRMMKEFTRDRATEDDILKYAFGHDDEA